MGIGNLEFVKKITSVMISCTDTLQVFNAYLDYWVIIYRDREITEYMRYFLWRRLTALRYSAERNLNYGIAGENLKDVKNEGKLVF